MKNSSRSKRIAELKREVKRLERRVEYLMNETPSMLICRTYQHELRMKPSQAEKLVRGLTAPFADHYLPPGNDIRIMF